MRDWSYKLWPWNNAGFLSPCWRWRRKPPGRDLWICQNQEGFSKLVWCRLMGAKEDRGVLSPRGRTMFFAADIAVAARQHFKCQLSELTISQNGRKNAGYHLWVLERNPGFGKHKTFTRTSKPVWPLLWREIMCLLTLSAIQRCLKNSSEQRQPVSLSRRLENPTRPQGLVSSRLLNAPLPFLFIQAWFAYCKLCSSFLSFTVTWYEGSDDCTHVIPWRSCPYPLLFFPLVSFSRHWLQPYK